jgi:hypothetical protein
MGKDTKSLRILTREEILAARDIPEEVVPCPEWGEGCAVLVRGLTLGEAHQAIKEIGAGAERDVEKMNLWALTRGIRGEDGQPLFTEADHAALLEKSSAPLLRITKVFTRISGLGEEAVEETAKNSSETEDST